MGNKDFMEYVKSIDVQKSFLQKRENGVLLSDNEISILSKYGIDYRKYSNTNELLFEIEEYLNDNPDLDDLENLSNRLSEFMYYYETKK